MLNNDNLNGCENFLIIKNIYNIKNYFLHIYVQNAIKEICI